MEKIKTYLFDDFEVDLQNRQLKRTGKALPLNTKYFDVLVMLLKHRGQLTTKQQIFDEIWQDVIVTDSALSQCIKDIRKQLSDPAGNPRYIKTIPKHGYVFLGKVNEITSGVEQTYLSGQEDLSPRPYKFLDYYGEKDVGLFFGRESEIEIICSKILSSRSFIIHGRSGVGKSSIVHAGLIPALKKLGHLVFVIRSFIDPMQEIIKVIQKAMGVNKLPEGVSLTDNLVKMNAEEAAERSIIIFLDQFEEFFLLLPENKRKKFISDIGKIVAENSSGVNIVFALREDLLAEMSHFKTAIPQIFYHEYRLRRLNHEQAIRAMIEPAKVVGCPFENDLPERILNDLNMPEDIDPPHIQIVCDALFDERDKTAGITISIYRELGGAPKILAGYLGRVLHRFNTQELFIAKEILKTLISAKEQPLILKIEDVNTQVERQTDTDINLAEKLIEDLAASRIIRVRRQDGESWIELSHEFLVPEITSWLSEEESALIRARALLERSMENYDSHQLLIENDSIDVILPFGENLKLVSEEANLLARSMLKNKRHLPKWLISKAPDIQGIFIEAAQENNPDVRICAIQSSTEYNKSLLKKLALWDQDLLVRKEASIRLFELFKDQAADILLSSKGDSQKPGIKRLAFSFAFVRDYNKDLVRLLQLPLLLELSIVIGLMWVRMVRSHIAIIRQTIGGTLGAALSGLSVGFILGISLMMARQTTSFETFSTLLVLMSLGTLAGTFAGFGISSGIAVMNTVSYRHSHWWTIMGGALGGATVGALGNLLGVDTLWALFGQNLSGITGAFEGLLLGGGTALGLTVVIQWSKQKRLWQQILGAACGAMMAAILLTLVRGNLFSGSIEIIARSFANSHISLKPLAPYFGEVNFGKISRIVLAAIEGFLFGGFMSAGMRLSKK